jgi:hypothetical protein
MCLAIFPRVPTVIDPLMVIIHTGMELDLCHAEEKTFTAQIKSNLFAFLVVVMMFCVKPRPNRCLAACTKLHTTATVQQCNNKKEKTGNNSVHTKMPNTTP